MWICTYKVLENLQKESARTSEDFRLWNTKSINEKSCISINLKIIRKYNKILFSIVYKYKILEQDLDTENFETMVIEIEKIKNEQRYVSLWIQRQY